MRLAPLRGARKPEVQMSPLIDVIFLLLIFYAVTTQFVSDERLKLKLPEAQTAESVGINREEKPPEVKVAVDGTIWIDDQIVPDAQLENRIEQLVKRAPDDGIILKGDQGADYGVVVRVLDVA
ncbi:MAG: biopolymer transporter ExbD, partial [Holophagae bacterium]